MQSNINEEAIKNERLLTASKDHHCKLTLTRVFGFEIDTSLSVKENAAQLLSNETNVIRCAKLNLSYHNLLPSGYKLPPGPPGTRSLLRLGIKFCIERPRPYQDICSAMLNFRRSVDLRMHLIKSEDNQPDTEFNPHLNVNLREWQPDPCKKPHVSAFLKFESTVNSLRKKLPIFRR